MPPPLPAAAAALWREAERRLYPLALSAPEQYERAVRLVRAVADQLREVTRSGELGDRFDGRLELVTGAAIASGTATEGLDLDAVAGAAFSLRLAVLEAEAARSAVRRRLATAAAEGSPWALLSESGTRREDGTVLPHYDFVEAYLPGSSGLHAWAQLDVDADGVLYGVEAVGVDLSSGTWWPDETSPVRPRIERNAESWRVAVAQVRATLAGT
ncbi:MAG: hypothetical protein ACRDYD_00600 [Acidimicrobiales bacterium]